MSHPELDSRHRVTMSDLPKVAPRLPPSAGNSSKVSCSPPAISERCGVQMFALTAWLLPPPVKPPWLYFLPPRPHQAESIQSHPFPPLL